MFTVYDVCPFCTPFSVYLLFAIFHIIWVNLCVTQILHTYPVTVSLLNLEVKSLLETEVQIIMLISSTLLQDEKFQRVLHENLNMRFES